MDLRKIADECGIGFLLDPDDEFFKGPQMEKFVERVISAASIESSEPGDVDDASHKETPGGLLSQKGK